MSPGGSRCRTRSGSSSLRNRPHGSQLVPLSGSRSFCVPRPAGELSEVPCPRLAPTMTSGSGGRDPGFPRATPTRGQVESPCSGRRSLPDTDPRSSPLPDFSLQLRGERCGRPLGTTRTRRLAAAARDPCAWNGRLLPDTELLDPWKMGTEATFVLFPGSFHGLPWGQISAHTVGLSSGGLLTRATSTQHNLPGSEFVGLSIEKSLEESGRKRDPLPVLHLT